MAWRGDDLEAEAKVNVHVLVDCLSSTVRGAQTHAGPGCSVVILLASAPRALALGPSVHPPHPRRRRRAALAAPRHPRGRGAPRRGYAAPSRPARPLPPRRPSSVGLLYFWCRYGVVMV